MMAGIRGKNTKPEIIVRRGLHALGFRYRLHDRKLPGKPDLVFPARQAVIFVHGCFWHGHDCERFKLPATRRDFWLKKLEANQARDKRNISALLSEGWRVMVVWECATRGRGKHTTHIVLDQCETFLNSDKVMRELMMNPEPTYSA